MCTTITTKNRTHNITKFTSLLLLLFSRVTFYSLWTMKALSEAEFSTRRCCLYQKWFSMRCFTHAYLTCISLTKTQTTTTTRSLTIFKLEQTSNSLQLLIIYNTWNPIKVKTFSRVIQSHSSLFQCTFIGIVCVLCVCVTLKLKTWRLLCICE